MSLSEKMTALCRTVGIAGDVPWRVALDMMEKNMGLESGGGRRAVGGGRRAAGGGRRAAGSRAPGLCPGNERAGRSARADLRCA